MKTIVFAGGNLYPYKIGGYEVFNLYLFKELKSFFNVKVLSKHIKPDYISKNDYIKIPNYWPSIVFLPLFVFLRLAWVKEKRKKVIVLSYSRSRWLNWWPYPLLNKLFGTKYILVIHGGGLTKWGWTYPYKKLFQYASHIIGVSQRICDEYERRVSNINIELIPPLIPFKHCNSYIDYFKSKINYNENTKVVLYVGSLKPLKNPNTIVEAAGLLGVNLITNNSLKFVFAGDGVLRNQLANEVQKRNLSDCFVFLGNVEREKISSLYSLAHMYIIASDFEGTPISLLEAMFNGLIAIGSNVSGINNIISDGHNGYLFSKGSAAELSNKIKQVIDAGHPQLDQIIMNAKKTINNQYRHDIMVDKYCKTFNKILDNE